MFWERVILDEGHEYYMNTLKNTLSMKEYIHKIESKYRWICTGTLFDDVYKDFKMYTYVAVSSSIEHIFWESKRNNKKLISEIYSTFCRKNIKEKRSAQIPEKHVPDKGKSVCLNPGAYRPLAKISAQKK